MFTSNILHASTDPSLLARLKEMLSSSARADIAVGYFFLSGFEAVAQDLARLDKVRVLVGRTDRRVLEEVASGLQQSHALHAQLDSDRLVVGATGRGGTASGGSHRRGRLHLATGAWDGIGSGHFARLGVR